MRTYSEAEFGKAWYRALDIVKEIEGPPREEVERVFELVKNKLEARIRMMHPAARAEIEAGARNIEKALKRDKRRRDKVTITDNEVPLILEQYKAKNPLVENTLKSLYRVRPDLQPKPQD